MTDDLFITGAEARELRDAVERRARVIRILESDLREAERKRGKLYAMLALICKEERGDRCGVLANCRDCTIKQTLEECK